MKSIVASIFLIVINCLSATSVIAQPMLKGSASFDNFITSPAMWILSVAVFFAILMILMLSKRKKENLIAGRID